MNDAEVKARFMDMVTRCVAEDPEVQRDAALAHYGITAGKYVELVYVHARAEFEKDESTNYGEA